MTQFDVDWRSTRMFLNDRARYCRAKAASAETDLNQSTFLCLAEGWERVLKRYDLAQLSEWRDGGCIGSRTI